MFCVLSHDWLHGTVLVPGYGAGAAFYFRNLADLSSRFRTYAVDMLGTGMSGSDAVLLPGGSCSTPVPRLYTRPPSTVKAPLYHIDGPSSCMLAKALPSLLGL